jgi:hypothetical protein
VPGGVAGGAGVRRVAGGSGVGEELVTVGVMAGERGAAGVAGARVGGGLGTGVVTLGEEKLPTPPAPSKWTYSIVKSSYVGVEPSSAVLSHAHPRPSLNTMSRVVRTR